MNSANLPPTSSESEKHFPTLTAMRVAHSELLNHSQDAEESGTIPQLLPEIEAFLHRGQATGALLYGEDDRWTAQGLLDYWRAILYRWGNKPQELTLTDYNPDLAPEIDDSRCPYLGLEAFQEKDRQFFYGRQRLLEELLHKLPDNRFLAVVGSSGSGKSSVVLGGLIPSLKAGNLPGSENWHYFVSMVPGSNPLANLARLLRPEEVNTSTWVQQQTEQFLQNPSSLVHLLDREDAQPSVLVIDQFEEMFTLCLDQTQLRAFIDNLLGVIHSTAIPHRIILTMRTDFESWVAKIPSFYPDFKEAKVYITPLDPGELHEAIAEPAKKIGLKFEAGLVEKLVQDFLGEPAALPLLQFTLLKLWDHRKRNLITHDTYKKIGDGRLALSNSADKFYNNLIPEDKETCKHIFLKMVRPTEGWEVTSSRVSLKELYQIGDASDRIERVLDKLIKARLVRQREGDTPGDTQIEVAHEALIRNWHQSVEWLEVESVNLRQRLKLKLAAEDWKQRDKDKSSLLRGRILNEAQSYHDLNELEAEFIKCSFDAEQAEYIAQRQSYKELEKRNQWLQTALVISFGLLLSLVALILRDSQKQIVLTSIESSTAQRLSQQQLDSMVTAITAGKRIRNGENWNLWERNDIVLAPEQRLRIQVIEALQKIGFEITQSNRWEAHARSLTAVVFSSKECRHQNIVSASENGEIKNWDQSGKLNQTLDVSKPKGAIWSLVMSADCSTLVSGGKDGVVRLWSRDNNQDKFKLQPQEFDVKHKHKGDILAVSVSDDGALIASAGADAKVSLWDSNGNWLRDLNHPQNEHKEAVRSVGFIPNSNNPQIVTAGTDSIKIWKQDGTFLQPLDLKGKDQFVYGVAYSPDGSRLVSAHENGSIKLWEQENKLWKLKSQPEKTHKGVVRAISFSSDGSKIISGGSDHTVKLWDVKKDTKGITRVNLIRTFEGNIDRVRAVAFHPNSSLVASAGADNTIRLWKAEPLLKSQSFLVRDDSTPENLENIVRDVDFSRDGLFVATASEDQRIRIWQKNASGFYEQKFITPSTPIEEDKAFMVVTFGPDPTLLASGNGKGEIMLWHRGKNDIKKIPTEKLHTSRIKAISFNADGSMMVSMSVKKSDKIAIWQQQKDGDYQLFKSLPMTDSSLPNSQAVKVQFVLDKRILAIVHKNGTVKFFEQISNGSFKEKTTTTLKDDKPDINITEAVFSADASLLASKHKDDTAIRIWQRNWQGNYQVKTVLQGHQGSIDDLAFSLNNKMLASGGQDKILRVWDLNSGEPINLPGHEKFIFGVAFSPDSKTLASVGQDQRLKLWDVDDLFDLDKTLAKSCAWLQDYLQYGNVADKDKNICSSLNLPQISQNK